MPRTKFRISCVRAFFGLLIFVNTAPLLADKMDQRQAAEDSSKLSPVKNRFIVTLIEKDERHPWYGKGLVGRGNEIAFAVDGVSGKDITVVRNQTYEFEIRSNPLHDFYLSTSFVGRGREVLFEGVEGNYTFDGIVRFKPTSSTPDVIYYQCQNHTYMGGRIYVVDKLGEMPRRDAASDKEAVQVVEEPQIDPETLAKNVNNKIAFAKLSIRNSSSARRVRQSNNPDAQAKLRQAEALISEAETTFQKGRITGAKKMIDEAIRTSSAAFQLVPDTEELKKKAKADYQTLSRGVNTSIESYRAYENLDRQGKQASTKIDLQKVQQTLLKARHLAESGDYDSANKILRQERRLLDKAVAEHLASRTFTYERSFLTQEDEYRYEYNRNQEYQRLVATIIEKINPSKPKMILINALTQQGHELRTKAETSAANRDFVNAIEALDNSTARYQNAIRMTGVQLFGN